MLYNATLLRIDPPAPASEGPPIEVRCALCNPSAAQSAVLAADDSIASAALAATVLYVKLADLGLLARPEVGGIVTVQGDGRAEEMYQVLRVTERIGSSLSHLEITLSPAG